MTTNPNDFIELIEVYCIALTNGLLEKIEVIKWADSIILDDSEPDIFFIELSLCQNKSLNDTISILNNFVGQEKPQISGRVILGLLYTTYSAKKISLRKVVETIYWIVWQTRLSEDEKYFMYGLDEDYDCAKDGIFGSIEEVENETLRFLEIYKDFQIDNYRNWKEIETIIDSRITLLTETIQKEHEVYLQTKTKKKWWNLKF